MIFKDVKITDFRCGEKGLNLIKQWEGFEPKPYVCSAGKQTIGYGHVILKHETYSDITESYAQLLLRNDLVPVEVYIAQKVKVNITQNQFDALCSLVHNIGVGAFGKSTGLLYLNKGLMDKCAYELFDSTNGFVNVNGSIAKGLVNRRRAEDKLWHESNLW